MSSNDHRPAAARQQAHRQADQTRSAMEDKRAGQEGGFSGWVAERAGDCSIQRGMDALARKRAFPLFD